MTERRSALHELTLARFRLFFREPSAVFWSFGFPILLSIALGVAFRSRPPEAIRIAVEAGPGAERVVAALASPQVKASVEDGAAARDGLRSGKVALVVAIAPDTAGAPGSVARARVYRFDPARPEARLARLLVDDLLQRADGRVDPAPATDETATEPGARYIDFLLPGLVGFNVMSSSMWGIGYVIVEWRTKKLVKRLMATPMRKSDFLLSFVVMRLLFVMLEVPILFGFGRLAFGERFAGSLLLVGALSVLGALSFAGLGLLTAARAANTQTVNGLLNLVMMPMMLGSGVFFSTTNFPDGMQPLIRALPLTALNDGLRAVINEGAGLAQVAPQAGVLAAWGVVSFAAALRLFRWL